MYDNAQRLQPTPLPTEILYPILFHDNTSANGNTLYHLVSQLHHRWHTPTSYLFLPNGVTVPSPSPFPYTRKPISHTNKPTWMPVALRLGRGMHAVQASFCGEALPTYIRWAFPYRPPKNTQGGGPPFPITTYGHLPVPYLGDAVKSLSSPT